ncbi:MAG: 2-oxo acid dehydrogenase subunit E2 [Microbacterium sp.]
MPRSSGRASLGSSWDDEAGEIVTHHYVNLGIAVATERGLIVPNIPDAEQLTSLSSPTRSATSPRWPARDGRHPPRSPMARSRSRTSACSASTPERRS